MLFIKVCIMWPNYERHMLNNGLEVYKHIDHIRRMLTAHLCSQESKHIQQNP